MAQYKIHIFKTSNTFSVSSITGNSTSDTIEYLAIGGGGGGGAGLAGGGGAGGFLTSNLQLTSSGDYVIEIGGAGAGEPDTNGGTGRGASGGNTYINLNGSNLFIALGGGGGGTQNYASPPSFADGLAGGSGGGAGGKNGSGTAGAAIGFPGPSAQGNPGGNGTYAGSGGGGGGAGAVGGTEPTHAGGAGLPVSWVPSDYGTTGPAPGRWFAGGGGGATTRAGGAGGGGASAPGGGPPATAGTINTGGGGGAGYNTYPTQPYQRAGAPGGSGIMIVKYPVIVKSWTPRISSVIDVATAANTYYGDQAVTLQVTTANVVTDETLYYSVNNASNSQVVGGNTGSFIITSNNYVEFPLTLNISGTSNITMQVRRNSGTGALLGESENVTIAERPIAGGTVFETENEVIHVFTTSGTLTTATSLSAPIVANLMLIGGGGQGGPTGGGRNAGGGGGAGGLRVANVELLPGNTFTIVVGAGGKQYFHNEANLIYDFTYDRNKGDSMGGVTTFDSPEGYPIGQSDVLFANVNYRAWGGGRGSGCHSPSPPSANWLVSVAGGSGGGGGGGTPSSPFYPGVASLGNYTLQQPYQSGNNESAGYFTYIGKDAYTRYDDGTVASFGIFGGSGNVQLLANPYTSGYPGGESATPGTSGRRGGGGGGATEAGTPATPTVISTGGAGIGVAGLPESYGTPGPNPTFRYFAGGGGGGSLSRSPTQPVFNGGIGGGGNGGYYQTEPGQPTPSSNTKGADGQMNTGGGGGGGGTSPTITDQAIGGAGGSGIVIIRYPK